MLELRVELRSKDEWDQWSKENSGNFATWQKTVLDSVQAVGLTEPITEIVHPPHLITVNEKNLRETISVAEMNSRKRAALLVFELARKRLTSGNRANPKILGTEALTRVARVLRGRFPYYLATEYLPKAEERARHFPICHLDLADIQFENGVFDMFHSGDVFEHLPDLKRSLAEIARVLKPGGVLVSTFPFLPERQVSRVKARMDNGKLELLEPAEYHGNPARPSEGSLVFTLPGWDILEACKASGLEDPRMLLVASSTFGIVSNRAPGVFVLLAIKPDAATAPSSQKKAAPLVVHYHGPELKKVIGLVALPRSGTTMLSSILGVNSQIKTIYEPWNDNKKNDIPAQVTLSNYFDVFPAKLEDKSILLLKETATDHKYIAGIRNLLASVEYPIERDLIWVVRNPLHVFLSEFEARRTWWGESKLEHSVEVFDAWARRTLRSTRQLLQLANEFNAILVNYEGFVQNTQQSVEQMMSALGIPFEDRQLNYEKHVRKSEVRGDINVATNPRTVNAESIKKREEEIAVLDGILKESRLANIIKDMGGVLRELEEYPVLRANSASGQKLIRSLEVKIAAFK